MNSQAHVPWHASRSGGAPSGIADGQAAIGRVALAGLAGGLLGSLAMDVFARAVRAANGGWEAPGAAPGSDRDGRGVQPPQAEHHAEDDAPSRVGAIAFRAVMGRPPGRRTRRRLGTAAHYGFGAAAGLVYALASRPLPGLRAVGGTMYGTLVWALADEGVLPALGLSRGPRALPAGVHLYALAGHWAYGATVECVRRALTPTRAIDRQMS